MSSNVQHGRRRAQPVRRKSALRQLWDAAPKPGSTGQRVAAVAAAGVLLVGMGVSDKAPHNGSAEQAGNAQASAISVPKDVAMSFTRTEVKSSAAGTPSTPSVDSSSSSVKSLGANGGQIDDPTGAQAYAATQLASFGWGQDQMACLLPLWNRESDWTTTAENPSSQAYGIAQSLPAEKMDSVGDDWKTNYQTQVKWGLGYIKDRYASPCGAWGHETSIGWY
jgi:hypothetical protein